jgi:hypothetical protein
LPKDSVKNKTLSPWIYTELSMIKYIEKKSANEHRQIIENFSKSMDSFDVEYEVDSLNNLPTLSFEEIEKLPKPSELWIKYWNECLVEEIKKINKQNKGE